MSNVVITSDLAGAIGELIKVVAERGVFKLEEYEFVAIVAKSLANAVEQSKVDEALHQHSVGPYVIPQAVGLKEADEWPELVEETETTPEA